MSRKEKKIKKYNKRVIVIRIILITAFILATMYVLFYFYNKKNRKQYENLDTDITTEEITKVNSEFVEKIRELQQENPDIKGWIRIDGTVVNYPLLQGTDNEYYFAHNYKKEPSKYGSIMINWNSNIKNPNENVIIYGHDMKDDMMFGELLNYKNQVFYEEHPIVKIATEEGEAEYQIMYVFLSKVFYQSDKDVFRYYYYYNFDDEIVFNEYLNNCKELQLYDTGITAEYGEQLLTLITCEYSQDNGRIVVVAKKVS